VSRQVQSDIQAWVKRFTITFTMYIRRSRSSVITEIQEIELQIALGGRETWKVWKWYYRLKKGRYKDRWMEDKLNVYGR